MKKKLKINLIGKELLLTSYAENLINKFASVNEDLKVGIINRFQDYDGTTYAVEKLENSKTESIFKIERSFETRVSFIDEIVVTVKSDEKLTEDDLSSVKGVLLLIYNLKKDEVLMYNEFISGDNIIKLDDEMIIFNHNSNNFKDSIFPKKLILNKKDPK